VDLLEEHRDAVRACSRCFSSGDDAPVGGLAIKELLGITRLSEAVGETVRRDGIVYVPLPHPSGASTWLNAPENKERLDRALATLKEQAAALKLHQERELRP
jgi:hypothetical protein